MADKLFPVTEIEARDLIQSGVDPEAVKTLIRDRASAVQMQKDTKEKEKLDTWKKELDAKSQVGTWDEYNTEAQQLKLSGELANAPKVDMFSQADADTLAADPNFSLEAYVAENPGAPYDERSDKLAQVWKKKHQQPITAADVGKGIVNLIPTTAHMIWNLGKGLGTSVYDTVSPLATTALPSAMGTLTGQGPEFQAELVRKQEENDRRLVSDLAGLEQGTFNFASWISNMGKTAPRRFANTKPGAAFGFDTWDDIPDDQLKREFQGSMEKYLQSNKIAEGDLVLGGEIAREVKERGQELDEDRVATMAEADPLGFFMFGKAFQVGMLPIQGAKGALKSAEQLTRARAQAAQIRSTLPPGDPGRRLADALVKDLEAGSGRATKALDSISKVTVAADRLTKAQLRLRMAQDALKRFGDTPARQASVESASANLQAAQKAVTGFAPKTLSKIQNAASQVSGVKLGTHAVGRAVGAVGQAIRPVARAIEAAPKLAGVGLILAGRPGVGLGLLFGARASGLEAVTKGVAKPLRKAQAGLGHLSKVIRSETAATPYQKALQGVVRGSVETVAEGLKGVPVDVGFALALAESPEDVQNMSGYAAAFRGAHALGRPLSRFVQYVKGGAQDVVAPAFLPRQAGNVRNAAAASEGWRRNLPPEQQKWVAAQEQFLRDMGSQAPIYGMDNAQFKAFLMDQHQRRNGRPPTPEEAADIENYSKTRGVFMEEVIGDDGKPGSALIVTDAQAVPHEGMHAFQQMLGENGNRGVDQMIIEDLNSRGELDSFGEQYANLLLGEKRTGNWREDLQSIIPESVRRDAGGDPVAAADIYIAREAAAEAFGHLFSATGGRPQLPTTIVEKLATVVDRTANFFGLDLMAGIRTEGLAAPVSGKILDAIRQQVQRQGTQVAGERAEGTLPAQEPSGRPAVREPVAIEPRAPERQPNLREPPITDAALDEFQAKTPERLNINMARDMAKEMPAEQQLVVDIIAQALQRKPGEAVVLELENLSVIPEHQQKSLNRDVRRAEQAVPDAVRAFFSKRIAVTRFLSDAQSGGKLQLAAMSMDKVLANIFNVQERLHKAKATDLTPWETDSRTGQLTENGWNSAVADLTAYTANQANGYRGGGKEIVRPEAALNELRIAIPEQNPSYRPKILPDNVEQYINTVMGLKLPKTPREQKGIPPGNLKGQLLREAQGEKVLTPADIVRRPKGFKRAPERQIQEVNPLRQEMNKRGVDTTKLLDVTERLNVDRLQNVTPKFDLQFNLPATDVIRAGFMPREAVAERAEFKTEGPRSVKEAAFRMENGELLTGYSHFDALLKGINEGRVSREALERGIEDLGMEDGFVDNQGKFITREEAFELSKQAGQISEEAAKDPSFRGGELESVSFEKSRQFLPADTAGVTRGKVKEAKAAWAQKGVESPFFKRWFGESKVVDESGQPEVVFHGTTHEFNVFDKSRANIENDMGQGFYFTSERFDAQANYKGLGPDLRNRVERRAEQIQLNKGGSWEAAREKARKEMVGSAERQLDVYLKMENPVKIGEFPDRRGDETIFRVEEDIDVETGEFMGGEPRGSLVDFTRALRRNDLGLDLTRVSDDIMQRAFEEGGELRASELTDIIRKHEDIGAFSHPDTGDLAHGEVMRQAFEAMGYDGIIDRTAGTRFRTMENVTPRTTHYIAFDSKQVKSAEGRGTFDPASPDIRFLPKAAEEVAALTPKEFAERAKGMTGGITGEAVRIGKEVTSEADIAKLREHQEKAQAESKAAMASGDFDNAMAAATKSQFFREAMETATQTGSMAHAMETGRIAALPKEDVKREVDRIREERGDRIADPELRAAFDRQPDAFPAAERRARERATGQKEFIAEGEEGFLQPSEAFKKLPLKEREEIERQEIEKDRYKEFIDEGEVEQYVEQVPASVRRHTADTISTPTEHAPKPEITKPLAKTGVPVNQDGGISAGPALQAMPREWKKWLDEHFFNNPEVRKHYSQKEMDNFAKGMEQTAKLFGDFSTVPVELAGDPVRANSDPMFGLTFDLTTVCPKQDQFVAVTKALEAERGRVYTPTEKAQIGEMLREAGQATCWICYGQAARNSWDAAAQKVSDVLNNVTKVPDWKKLTSESDTRRVASQEKLDRLKETVKRTPSPENKAALKAAREERKTAQPELDELFKGLKTDGDLRKFIDANIDALRERGDINGPQLRDLLRGDVKPAPGIEEMMVGPLNGVVQGMALANAPKGFSPYSNQLLTKAMKRSIDFFNDIAGFRMNSQSDFRIWHTLDTAQFLSHLQSQEGMAHVYTRIDEMLQIFGDTGIKFNMSVEASDPAGLPLAARVGNVSMEQYKRLVKRHGEPLWDDMNSFPEERVDYWREKLPNDAGAMLVAANDFQVWWGLESPKIDMIIPFHQGSVKPETTAFYGARDYTKQGQHEHFPSDWKPGETRTVTLKSGEEVSLTMGGTEKKIQTPLLNRKVHKNNKARYLEITERFGITPKFPRFTEHRNYMKLVRDAARNPSKQKVVDASKINWEAAMRSVDNYVKSGTYDKETKPDKKLLDGVRKRIEQGALPESPVVKAQQAMSTEEIIKAGKELRAKGATPEAAFEIKPMRGPGDKSVFDQIKAIQKEQGKKPEIKIKPRRK
jgi:hypothetical protein